MGRNGSGKTTLAYALMGHPAYQVTHGRGPLEGPATSSSCRPTSAPGWASSSPSSTRPPSPACRWRASCAPPSTRARGRSTARRRDVDPSDPTRRRHQDGRLPQARAREDGSCSSSTTASPRATSTRASRAARRSAWRCSRWPSCSPRWRSSTRPTPASTSTRCASSPRASTRSSSPDLGVLLITHYQRLLNYIKPDVVHVLAAGRIIASGGTRAGAAPRGGGLRADPARGRPRADPTTSDAAPEPAEPAEPAHGSDGHRPRSRSRRHPRRLPDLRARLQRPPAGLSGLGRDVAQAARRRRRRQRLPDALHGQHPSRHLQDRRGGDGRLRGRAQVDRVVHQRRLVARDRDGAQRDRGHQPGGLLVGPNATSARPTPSC